MEITLTDYERVNQAMKMSKAGERISWLYETYGDRVVASSSFGLQAAVMLHLISEYAPKVPVIFVDTGYLFPETYNYVQTLKGQLDVDVRTYVPAETAACQNAVYGELWKGNEEEQQKYAVLNKIEPMNRALKDIGGDIWLSGVRRAQSSTRVNRDFVEQQNGTIKAYPILDWADAQVYAYFSENDLPRHPLEEKGYETMGDWHSTVPAKDGVDAETSRYGGTKYECGLHYDSGIQDFQI